MITLYHVTESVSSIELDKIHTKLYVSQGREGTRVYRPELYGEYLEIKMPQNRYRVDCTIDSKKTVSEKPTLPDFERDLRDILIEMGWDGFNE